MRIDESTLKGLDWIKPPLEVETTYFKICILVSETVTSLDAMKRKHCKEDDSLKRKQNSCSCHGDDICLE